MIDINNFVPASGRVIREDGSLINQADMLVAQAALSAKQAAYADRQHDRLTGAMKVINTDHYYVHRGIAYKAFIELSEVGATPVEYSFRTPQDLYPHLKNLELTALGGTCRVTVRRGTAANPLNIDSPGTVSGDVTGPHNLNDAVDNVTGVQIRKTPIYVAGADGEVWFPLQVVGDSTNQFTSVADTQKNPNEEYVLKPDTYYVIRLERIGSDSPQNILLVLFWYEEPDGVLINEG